MPDSIACPNCKTEIPLTEAISRQVEERLRAGFEAEKAELLAERSTLLAKKDAEVEAQVAKARDELTAAAEVKAAEKVATKMRDLSARLEEQDSLRREAQERELELLKEKRELEVDREALELQVQRQIDEERATIVAWTPSRSTC